MIRSKRLLVAIVVAIAPHSASLAQKSELSGPYIAPALTIVDHHFVIEETAGGVAARRNVTRWGVGGAAIAGYNFDLGNRLLLGLQGQVSFGGRTAETGTALGNVSLKPRWGYSGTARLGYRLSEQNWIFAGGGYGGHRYRTSFPAGVNGFDEWNRSFVLTAGMETRLREGLRARLEFQHLDGTRNEFLIAFPIKF